MGMTRMDFFDRLRVGLPTRKHHIPEWDKEITIRGLSAGQRDQYELMLKDMRDEGELAGTRALLVAMCVVDDEGNRIFKDSDADELNGLPAMIKDPIVDMAARLSGLLRADLEQIEKNSEPVQTVS